MARKRVKNNRDIKQRILILAEGETELIYLRALKRDVHLKNKLTAARIIPYDSEKNTGRELVEIAKQLKKEAQKEQNRYEKIFIVLDKDGYTRHPETFNTAKDNEIDIIFTSISFEYWFLIHFEYTTRAFVNCNELVSYLKRYMPNYDKTKDYYEIQLSEKTTDAIQYARKVQEYFQNDIDRGAKIYELSCYTNVDKLVVFLINL